MIRVIGIGSPFGDDAVGLEAARQLAADPPPDAEVVAADRPGATLLELLDGADAVILIDAARSGAAPGTIHDLDLHALPSRPIGLISSHELGVVETIQLAARLGCLPPRGRVLGIEVAGGHPSQQTAFSPSAVAAVSAAVQRARQWCTSRCRKIHA
jgi:hydrogenase maturation protease